MSGKVRIFMQAQTTPIVVAGPTIDSNGQPTRQFVKDIMRVGEWVNGGETFNITAELLDQWVKSFERMQAAGVKVPVPVGHTSDADANRGYVEAMYREGDTLYARILLIGEDAIRVASRAEVSVYVPEKIVDGKGNVYHAAIEHVALVTNPVVSGQGPFIPIAASRKRYNRGKPMDWKKVAEALGLDPASLTEENAEAAILEAIAGMSGKAKDYPEMESRAKKAEAALEASRKNAPADGRPLIDEDALEMAATAACNGFRGLVKEGKITPAAEKRLVAALVGEPNRRIECGLSPKAAKHAGLAGPLANTIIGILEENAPMPLGGSKTLAASRANVDDAQQRAEEIIKRIRRESGQPV